MNDDGVFLNPNTGDIIATGQVSASQVNVPTTYDYLVAGLPVFSNYYSKSETSSASQLSLEFEKHPLSTDFSFQYSSEDKKIYLNIFNGNVGQVDCTDFLKDGMLSSVSLCGNVLEFVFNTDSGKTPISVNLSSFVDNYDGKITALSDAISTIGEDYLTSDDKKQLYNDLLSPDEVKLYKGPGDKDITLSVGTGSQLCTYTATLSDFYLSSETSSSTELKDKFDTLSTYSEIHDQLSNDGYWFKTTIRDWT